MTGGVSQYDGSCAHVWRGSVLNMTDSLCAHGTVLEPGYAGGGISRTTQPRQRALYRPAWHILLSLPDVSYDELVLSLCIPFSHLFSRFASSALRQSGTVS